jgi:ABC-2 type transport system ATP-binding protein
LLRPTSGSCHLLGQDVARDYLPIRKHIGFLPDFFNMYGDLTLRECLRFFAEAYGMPANSIGRRVTEVLDYIDLKDKGDDLVRHLSLGMVQRIGVGVLLVRDPELLLLDEPASGLDPKARIQLRDILRRLSAEGKTIIISSHILTELSGFCTHVAIMDKGRIQLSGAVDDLERTVLGARRIDVTILGEASRAADIAGRFAGARVAAVQDNKMTIELGDDPTQIAALNAHLVKEGVEVIGLCEQKTNLEDLFMKISGGTQNEAA